MWSDNDIDKAFQRLNPPDPEPTSFPLDAWLRLETQLDKAVVERAVRQKLWRFFAAEVAIVTLIAFGWLLWPTNATAPVGTIAAIPKTITYNNIQNNNILFDDSSRAAAPGAATATTAAAALATGLASSGAPDWPALSRASSTQATTVAKRPTIRLGAAHALPLLAAKAPGKQRKQSHKNSRSVERLTESRGLVMSLAIIPASRKGLRKSEGTQARTFRRAATSTVASATADEAAAQQTAETTSENNAASSANNSALATPATGRDRQSDKKPHPLIEEAVAAQSITTSSATAPTSATTNASTLSSALAVLVPQPVALETTATPELSAPLTTVATVPSETVLPLPHSRFYIGLVAAPDVSTVKFAGVQSPLLNVGVTFEYHLTNRLRLSTGLLHAPKQYMARRGDYDWGAYRNLVYQHNFEYVDGSCTVLDVPLNLRYDLLSRPHYKVFGSAGLSSYFMQREEYSYDWVDQNGPGTWEKYVTNENRNLFSIINLSFGYERSLGAHWSLQAEPYLKMPLSGVGVGKVQLVSGGVFFGAKYGF